jgi:hypothetical protein
MVNINLTTEKINVKKPPLFKREVVILGGLLAVLVMAYGGLLFYEKSIMKKIEGKDAEYMQVYRELTEGNTKSIFDFQNRLSLASSLFSTGNPTLDNLKKMEEMIIPGIYISSFDYDIEQNKIKLNLAAQNYNLIAKQVLSFKKSGYFLEVGVSSSQIDANIIRFPVSLTLN